MRTVLKEKNGIQNLVVLLVLLIIVVISINYIWNDDKKEEAVDLQNEILKNSVVLVSTDEDTIEKRLEKILSKISGVGKVYVMITNSESSTFQPIYNENTKSSNTIEQDEKGGTRTILQEDMEKEIIYKENMDGSKEPVTKSVVSPKIEGAIIAAEGADNAETKTNIIQAVEAATGLPTHKIQVFKMEV